MGSRDNRARIYFFLVKMRPEYKFPLHLSEKIDLAVDITGMSDEELKDVINRELEPYDLSVKLNKEKNENEK